MIQLMIFRVFFIFYVLCFQLLLNDSYIKKNSNSRAAPFFALEEQFNLHMLAIEKP